jgi:hypothetical protein
MSDADVYFSDQAALGVAIAAWSLSLQAAIL